MTDIAETEAMYVEERLQAIMGLITQTRNEVYNEEKEETVSRLRNLENFFGDLADGLENE